MYMNKWERADNYIGKTYYDFYVGYAQHRDSDILTRANWNSIIEGLEENKLKYDIIRSSHWAVGWVEFILIHKNHKKTINYMEDIYKQLENYPVLDDMLFSDMEYTENIDGGGVLCSDCGVWDFNDNDNCDNCKSPLEKDTE